MGRRSQKSWITPLLIAVSIAVPVAVAIPFLVESFKPPEPTHPQSLGPGDGMMMNTPFIAPGLRTPRVHKAHEVELPDDELMIGVTVEGRHRAYRCAAMRNMIYQVINDLIGEFPVTVTYCEQTGNSRLFTAEHRGQPLEVGIGGRFNGLLLRVDGRFFQQGADHFMNSKTDALPLRDVPHTRTTWKKWRDLHPDTEVFVGTQVRAAAGDGAGEAKPLAWP